MTEVKREVERLFKKYPNTEQTIELKEEMISNLEAKINDLMTEGYTYNEALKKSVADIGTVDHLLDSYFPVYTNRFKLEYVQVSLLVAIIVWIVTIPMNIFVEFWYLNIGMLTIIITLAIVYVTLSLIKNEKFLNKVAVYSIDSLHKMRKTAWVIWGLFMTVTMFTIIGLQFGSNIWFKRPIIVEIDGPYSFALFVIPYVLPFFTIVIPFLFSKAVQLIKKYKVGETDAD